MLVCEVWVHVGERPARVGLSSPHLQPVERAQAVAIRGASEVEQLTLQKGRLFDVIYSIRNGARLRRRRTHDGLPASAVMRDIPGARTKVFAKLLICASEDLHFPLRIASSEGGELGAKVQFLFADHVLDTDRRELRRGSDADRRRAAGVRSPRLPHAKPRPRRQQGRSDRFGLGRTDRVGLDADQPHQRRAQGDRRQRRGAKADPHDHRARASASSATCACNRKKQTLRRTGEERDSRAIASGVARCPIGPAIAVLPFTNMSDDPEQDYFSDGISEDIITALSKLRWFFVIARNSSFAYKDKSDRMKQIGEELGVGYLVEGSVRKSGDRVRITAQLNDAATGNQLWAERYDRDLADVFAVQDEITEAIVAAIEPQIYAAENFRARRKPPEKPRRLGAW